MSPTFGGRTLSPGTPGRRSSSSPGTPGRRSSSSPGTPGRRSSSDDWITRYSLSHQHPVNRFCHTLGIPLIVLSIGLAGLSAVTALSWWMAITFFIAGWVLQFIGHAVEGKPPEFLHDWRFLFVGLRWWLAKVRGRA